MFCAFDGRPEIVRLHGRGELLTERDEDYGPLAALFPPNPGTRAVIRVRVTRVSTSCGFSVPLMEFRHHRETLDRWAAAKGPEGLAQYRADKNVTSIDGLPALSEGV